MNDPSRESPPLHEYAAAVLAGLRERFPDAPFLALGQTALWDEPTKAALRLILDGCWPEARMIAAAHDTDYFAKLPGHPAAAGHAKYALVLHDDAKTRGLWSAAGEMSRLFGSEDVATRDELEQQGGVLLHRALAAHSSDPAFVLSELTAAWGWTGIIYTEWDRKVVRDIPLADILPTLLEQTDWALDGSIETLEGARAESARAVRDTIRGWITTFARANPEASLSDLYRDLYPRFYEILLGAPPANLATSCTSRLLRFNRDTAHLPRFAFVELFLNPITRRAAIDAYNLAVAGSSTYTLDRFGDGALPFDLVIPGRGRGTLCVPGDGTIYVDLPREPITLCDEGCDFASTEKLAALVERELGPDVTLVGKAVSLLPMLAAEFLLVFHEGASGYSDRTRAMIDRLAARNIRLPELKPILRVRYSTWDALCAVPESGPEGNGFRLPEHLAQAFSRESISVSEFAACWRCAVRNEQRRLNEMATIGSPRDLLDFLSRQPVGDTDWVGRRRAYEAATLKMLAMRDHAQAIQGRVYTLYDQVRRVKAEAAELEKAKGDDFRARIQPLRERRAAATDPAEAARLQDGIVRLQEERALHFDAEIASRRSQVRYAIATVRDLKASRLALERGEAAAEARATLRGIEAEAELARARMARNALEVIHGLPHTDYRPSSWWFPLVDGTGAWFQRLAATAELHLEPLAPEV